ncbi:hypothetical protein ACOSQ2_020617 [Xanthoceras sorbifolium]
MGNVGVGKICFPSPITHFCAAAGVDVYGEEEIVIQPPPNLDRGTYNALGRGQRDPKFVSRRHVRPRINDEDLMAGNHDPETNQAIPPPWAAAMFNSLERRFDGLKKDINYKFQYLNKRVGAMETTLGTIKLSQCEMQNEDSTIPHA